MVSKLANRNFKQECLKISLMTLSYKSEWLVLASILKGPHKIEQLLIFSRSKKYKKDKITKKAFFTQNGIKGYKKNHRIPEAAGVNKGLRKKLAKKFMHEKTYS